jgi:hypothetical protein
LVYFINVDFYVGSKDISVSNVTIFMIGMKPVNKIFINIDTSGTFSLKDCVIKMAEVFYSWESPGNAWNGTFINLNNGTFIFENSEFVDIEVSGLSFFISAVIADGKEFTISNCVFKNCGSLSNKMMYIDSSIESGTYPLTISNTHFISCFSSSGGTLCCNSRISLSVSESEFVNCVTKDLDGGSMEYLYTYLFYFFLFFIF